MMPKQEIYEMIDSYLEGGMSVSERDNFEKMIQSDPELAKEVEAFRLANAVVSDYGLVQLRGKLDKIHNEHMGGGSSGGIGTAWITGIVGLLITISGVVTYQYLKPKESSIVEAKKVIINESPVKEVVEPEKVVVQEETNPESENAALPQKAITKPQLAEKRGKKEKNVDCNSVYITGEAHHFATCEGRADGIITVVKASLQGGAVPYRYSLDNHVYKKDNEFRGLSVGVYTVYVQDKNNCITKLTEIEVKSRDCNGHSFNPDNGAWSVPVEKGMSGQLVVFNRKGNAVYQSKFEAGENVIWNGKTTSGADLPAGNYGFDISYSNGTSRGGTVTILK